MLYSFIGFIIFSIFIIVKNHKNESAIWFFVLLAGFCLSVLGLMFYSVYIWDYSYMIRKLFFNLNKNIWLFIYYLKIDSGMVMRMISIGTALFSYATIGLTLSIIGYGNRKLYWLLMVFPASLVLLYDPFILQILYKAYRSSHWFDYVTFTSLLKGVNLFGNVWIKLYILASIAILVHACLTYKNINYKKRVFYLLLGITPIYILYILLFYWVPQPFIVLRDFEISKSVESWEISKYLMINISYGRFTYIAVLVLSVLSVTLLTFAIVKHNLFESHAYRNKLIFSNTYMTANQGSRIFTHSIKNQLVAIRMIGENLDRKLKNDGAGSREIEEILSICNDTINKLNTLRDMSKPPRLHLKPTDMGEYFSKLTKKRFGKKERLMVNLDTRNAFTVLIDRDTFAEAVFNMVDNAIESMDCEREGTIDISFGMEAKLGIVNIKDNGAGIPEENLPKIFTPFFTTKPTTSNWGIGLSFCKNVIEAFGGEIQVISEVNRGTTFKVFLPLYRGEQNG